MNENILKQSIDKLQISNSAIKKLGNNNINSINQLCRQSKEELKKMKISQIDIRNIEISLQLVGLKLKDNTRLI